MSTIKKVVDLIENKLKVLLENYSFLKNENEILYNKIGQLEYKLAEEKRVFKELENSYNSLKIAKTIEGSKEDKRETKLKINALIREIDACIVQLNE